MDRIPNVPTRYAILRNADSYRQANAYLPENYTVIWQFEHDGSGTQFVVEGQDAYGWTLDGYVIPRCHSGNIWVEEIDLSHPIMREIPLPTITYSRNARRLHLADAAREA